MGCLPGRTIERVSLLTRVTKRLVIGRPVSSDRLGETTLSKRMSDDEMKAVADYIAGLK